VSLAKKKPPGKKVISDALGPIPVKFYNATGSLARFENNFFFFFEKRYSLLQRWRCSCKFKNLRIGSWGQSHGRE
jgi:hypothetical protein